MLHCIIRRAVQSKMAFNTPPEVVFRNILRAQKCRATSSQTSSSGPPNQYKAAVVQELGKPMTVKTMPMLKPKENEVLIEVEAAGVNFADILKSAGQYQDKATVPYVPGTELCGHVRAVGQGVKNLQLGQKVIGLTGVRNGAFAEFCVIDGRSAIPIPESVPSVTGASALVSYGTAMMSLTRMAKVQAGETVLVTAAAGATGMAIMDIAANVLGAKVIAVCGGQEKCAKAMKRGATYTIDYINENLRERIKEITKGKGINVVLDQVGGDLFIQCLKSIAQEGRLVTIGYASGKIPSIPANIILLKSCSVHGVFWGNTSITNPPAFFKSIQDTMAALQEGKINPYCGHTYPLDQVNEAFNLVLSRKSTGKVVIVLKP